MSFFNVLIKASVAVLASLPICGSAQTYRVNCGVDANGVRTFMDVYEYDYVTIKPTFPGGDDHLLSFVNKTRVYPAEAYRHGVQGRVMCSFIVNTDGSVSNLRVIRGVEPSLNAEAIRILSKMPAWNPGKMDGHAVPVRVIYPVSFRK